MSLERYILFRLLSSLIQQDCFNMTPFHSIQRHTLCVSEDGEAWSFGLGHFGVLGRSYTPYEYHSAQALSNMGVDVEEQVAQEEPQQLAHIEQLSDEMRNHLDLLANLTLDDSSDQCYPKVIDALQGVRIINASAGHRHSMFLDSYGGVYTCGSGFGPTEKQEIPMKVMEFGKSINFIFHEGFYCECFDVTNDNT